MGGSATTRAVARANAEQASKPVMRKPTRLPHGEGCQRSGRRATRAPTVSAGVLATARMEEGDGRNTGSPAGGAAHVNRQPARVRSGRQGGGEVRRYRGSRVMPAEGRDLRWKRWRTGAGSREWPTAYHPGDERESRSVITCTSEGDGPERSPSSGRQQACRCTGGPAQGCRPGATARQTRPPVADREPVCEPHDSTGEPGAGNRHAGFGERGEETYPRESACGPARKRPEEPPTPTGYAPPPDSTKSRESGVDADRGSVVDLTAWQWARSRRRASRRRCG